MGSHKEIDRVRSARITHIVKVALHRFKPLFAFGDMIDNRAKDDEIVKIVAVFEK